MISNLLQRITSLNLEVLGKGNTHLSRQQLTRVRDSIVSFMMSSREEKSPIREVEKAEALPLPKSRTPSPAPKHADSKTSGSNTAIDEAADDSGIPGPESINSEGSVKSDDVVADETIVVGQDDTTAQLSEDKDEAVSVKSEFPESNMGAHAVTPDFARKNVTELDAASMQVECTSTMSEAGNKSENSGEETSLSGDAKGESNFQANCMAKIVIDSHFQESTLSTRRTLVM